MVPLVSTVSVGGIPLTQMMEPSRIEALVARTRKGGGEIVKLLGTGSAYYAPSAAAVQMVESVVRDKKRILPAAAWLEGEFGLEGMFLGVPCKLGRAGLEAIIQVELSTSEREALAESAAAVRETMEALGL